MGEKDKYRFTVFEHESKRAGDKEGDLPKDLLLALQKLYGQKGLPYYSLIHNGIRFCEYVGVLQVGNYTIEVLPKADNTFNKEKKESPETTWREVLLDMLKAVGVFDIQAPSSSTLKIRASSILDLYLKLFIEEVEYLLHRGLIKGYRKTEGNKPFLKGNILFAKHIQQNLVHKEKFYVRYTSYDNQHVLNAVLYKTLALVRDINTNPILNSRIGALFLNFPEMPPVQIEESFFDRIIYNRKTETYKNALTISRLLLLNYHPDVSRGKNDVLALMFDMNELWEKFVSVSLKKYVKESKHLANTTISSQSKFEFWKPENGYTMHLRPDILITLTSGKQLVIDTKWKNLNGYKPSVQDLRQMYTYSKFNQTAETILLYPGKEKQQHSFFLDQTVNAEGISCKIYEIPVSDSVKSWQQIIGKSVFADER